MGDYFEFSDRVRERLAAINDRYDKNLSPYAAKNADAVRLEGKPRYDLIRPAYSYDADRIINHPMYNRYADKTQVFSFYKNDDLTRRALHVQLVSKIARTIGRALLLNLELIEAIALGHDIGHTPFGHKGEEFLSGCYAKASEKKTGQKRYFNHNVHGVKIFRYILTGNLTLQTLSGILSHNGEKVCREYSPSELSSFKEFDALLEKCYTDNTFHKKLRPNTLEGCVVRISDMIAYAGRDRQDLYRAKIITRGSFRENRLIGVENRDIISNIVLNVIKNSLDAPALSMDGIVFDDLRDLIRENYELIYNNDELNEPYYNIIKPLMEKLYDRLVYDIESGNKQSPVFRHYLSDNIQCGFRYNEDEHAINALSHEIVTDFIASMTDDYFIDICNYLHIDDRLSGMIKYRGYFDSKNIY